MAVGSVVTPGDALGLLFSTAAENAGLKQRQKILSAAQAREQSTAPEAAPAPPAAPGQLVSSGIKISAVVLVAVLVGVFLFVKRKG